MFRPLLVIFGVLFHSSEASYLNRTVIKPVKYSTLFTSVVDNSVEYILVFSKEDAANNTFAGPPRVTVKTENATLDGPLMVVTRQPKELLSWKLPLTVPSEGGEKYYHYMSRTLCFDILKHNKLHSYMEWEHDNPIVSISTDASTSLQFNVIVDFPEYFTLVHSKPYTINISPSEPQYFFYNFSTPMKASDGFTSNYDTVILTVDSNDTYCTIVSIQNVSCPVFDLNQDITFRGFYETFTTKGGITIPKYKFPYGFYVVFVVKADDYECTRKYDNPGIQDARHKKLTIVIKPSIGFNDYIYAVILTLTAIGTFYIIFGLAFFVCTQRYYLPRQMEFAREHETINDSCNSRIVTISGQEPSATSAAGIVTISGQEPSATSAAGTTGIVDSQSLDEQDYDYIQEEQTDREVRLCRSQPYLTDLARKPPRVLARKSYLYLYNVLTVALFYGLPVVQLVVTYQRVLNETGEQDLCYYNFLCSHPLGVLSDFNHVFSNIGYVLLGILFLIITYRREVGHQDQDFDRHYGIPQHYGMFYAMGVALIMEGVLSGSYHVCPSKTNFQFDSSFMYVMAVLCMVKLYQNRHPDINANAYSTFGVLAVAILLGMIGILDNTHGFWIFFIVLHIVTCFYLSIKIYYLGCWKLSVASLQRLGHVVRNDFLSGPLNVLKPVYKARFIMLVLGNFCNWGLAAYALTCHPNNFAVFLLLVFMSNTLLYFVFYIFMKYLHGEKVKPVTWIFLCMSTLCAISAMYFFLHKAIVWSQTPAQSRTFNMECKLLRFYDFHDIWHFLSAIGMFFTFMVLLTLDDDLSHTHHRHIPVF